MGKFKVGDRVTIRKDSQYYGRDSTNPNGALGIVRSDNRTSGDKEYIYRVEWHGYVNSNTYREIDLELYDSTNVEKDILEEAKRIFKGGCTYKTVGGSRHKSESTDVPYVYRSTPSLEIAMADGRGLIYKNGLWGEVIEQPINKGDRLIAEARMRYPKGTYFFSAESGNRAKAFHEYNYDEYQDKLCDDGWAVYYKGKWATVDGKVVNSTSFEIGDRVVGNSLADDEEYDVTCQGWEGYVYKVNGDEIQVGYTLDPKESDDRFWVRAKCFNLLYTKETGRKFKVGDMIIGNHKANGRYSITSLNWVGTVKEVLLLKSIKVYGKGLTEESVVDEDCFDLFKEGSQISSSIKTSENGKAKHDDSGSVIKVPQLDFEVSRGNQIRGSRIDCSTSEVSIGNRHRHYETRSIRG